MIILNEGCKCKTRRDPFSCQTRQPPHHKRKLKKKKGKKCPSLGFRPVFHSLKWSKSRAKNSPDPLRIQAEFNSYVLSYVLNRLFVCTILSWEYTPLCFDQSVGVSSLVACRPIISGNETRTSQHFSCRVYPKLGEWGCRIRPIHKQLYLLYYGVGVSEIGAR